jgi:DNA-binding transcriptional LysR family regulator
MIQQQLLVPAPERFEKDGEPEFGPPKTKPHALQLAPEVCELLATHKQAQQLRARKYDLVFATEPPHPHVGLPWRQRWCAVCSSGRPRMRSGVR